MLAAGERACTAASAATLRSTLSGVDPSVPELLVTSCESFWDLLLSLRLSRCCFSFLSRLFARSGLRSLSRSLPEEVAREREPRCSVFWELRVRWLLLLLLRLLLLRPPQSPSPSLLMLLQALWPLDDDCVSPSPSLPLEDFLLPLSFSSGLGLLYSTSKGGTREPGHCLVERDVDRLA